MLIDDDLMVNYGDLMGLDCEDGIHNLKMPTWKIIPRNLTVEFHQY
jgi:hypothetical protein